MFEVMHTLEELKALIDAQVVFNRGKNMLCDQEKSAFGFQAETLDYLRQHQRMLSTLEPAEENILLEHLVTTAIKAFCQANQYYDFHAIDKEALTKLYRKLLSNFRSLPERADDGAYVQLASAHYRALQAWLKRSNPFVKKLYTATMPYLEEEVVCAEYSAGTQLQLLGIEIDTLLEPVLDLGCGQHAFLVNYLREHQIDAYGVDRNAPDSAYTAPEDWFEFDLSGKPWGTVISNMGFSNHFLHHHLRIGGDYTRYAIRYREILQALKVGGTFYYAPDLPFIEQYLSSEEFLVRKGVIEGTGYQATHVTRLA